MPKPSSAAPHDPAAAAFPVAQTRAAFPALSRAAPFIYFDNAAGAQAPQIVLDRVAGHLLDFNVQRGGPYAKSMEVDRVVQEARAKVALFLNADNSQEVAFGMNATSFMRLVSLAIGRTLTEDRNQIIVTDLDHHANISTWLELERAGAVISWWRMRADHRLHLSDLEDLLSERTRLLACTATSHALGTRIDVAAVSAAAHRAGAELFVDCVHYSPHGPIDVKAWDCDYLVCSGYKAFAPHMGFLWGKFDCLSRLPTFREEFIPDAPPHKIEAGTFIYENVAGMSAVIDYLEGLGAGLAPEAAPGRPRVAAAMAAIETYEHGLSLQMIDALVEADAVIYGLSDKSQATGRVPTFCFNLPGVAPAVVSKAMAAAGVGVRDGHMYAPRLMERLGLAMDQGAVRASLVHYNDASEIDRFRTVLGDIRRSNGAAA